MRAYSGNILIFILFNLQGIRMSQSSSGFDWVIVHFSCGTFIG